MQLSLCHNVYDEVANLKSADFKETKKSKYFENETLFFLQKKKNSSITQQGLLSGKK